MTNHRERRLEVGDDRSKVLVLSTYDDTHESVLRCGEVLSAVLLDATMVGLATCTLTHITEVAASRKIVAGLIAQRRITPQVLVRVGLTPSIDDVPPPTPRRPIGDVFDVRLTNNDRAQREVQEPPWESTSPSRSVVVGIDGSHSAIDAALWAVDEAVSRDVPLRLVYAIDPDATAGGSRDAARDLATAEVAVRYAFTAVESTDKPVKIEVEILQDRPVRALMEASRWAAMLCVGSIGTQTQQLRAGSGSTAAALASSAHCPVAVVRGHDRFRQNNSGWWPRSTTRRQVSGCCAAVSRRRSCEASLCGC